MLHSTTEKNDEKKVRYGKQAVINYMCSKWKLKTEAGSYSISVMPLNIQYNVFLSRSVRVQVTWQVIPFIMVLTTAS